VRIAGWPISITARPASAWLDDPTRDRGAVLCLRLAPHLPQPDHVESGLDGDDDLVAALAHIQHGNGRLCPRPYEMSLDGSLRRMPTKPFDGCGQHGNVPLVGSPSSIAVTVPSFASISNGVVLSTDAGRVVHQRTKKWLLPSFGSDTCCSLSTMKSNS
jgi:hypothetical protein